MVLSFKYNYAKYTCPGIYAIWPIQNLGSFMYGWWEYPSQLLELFGKANHPHAHTCIHSLTQEPLTWGLIQNLHKGGHLSPSPLGSIYSEEIPRTGRVRILPSPMLPQVGEKDSADRCMWRGSPTGAFIHTLALVLHAAFQEACFVYTEQEEL